MPDFSKIKRADISVADVLHIFTDKLVDVAFLSMTPTGREKSIMDAVASFRDFLKRSGIHDYAKQKQGPENKIELPCIIVRPNELQNAKASYYRPRTKQGDPRFWIQKYGKTCGERALFAFTAKDSKLYVFNMSDTLLRSALQTEGSFAHDLLCSFTPEPSNATTELTNLLRYICSMGFVPGVSHGDTNVGMTLERLLGIAPNASRTPDFKGIELKAGRLGGIRRVATRRTLFAQVPDWGRSAMHNSSEILGRFGYRDHNTGLLKLHCTVSAKPNAQNLFFRSIQSDLHNLFKNGDSDERVVLWSYSQLQEALSRKHKETFWVDANFRFEDGKEYFHYVKAEHTRAPNVHLFPTLVDAGIVTMDYLMNQRPTGGVRDHGYLFKIKPKNISMLFPAPETIDLTV